MTDAIAHRGPDGEGYCIDGAVGLGHRRLAIIDLSPPAISRCDADGRYVLTYNGEIYNFRELRAELEASGYQFRSRTDTEVVLDALATWGDGALTRFNGMFAFALWDRRAPRAAAGARSLRHQAALLRAGRRRRCCSAPRSRRFCAHPARARASSTGRRCSSTSRSRISSPTARCSRACGCCRPGRTCGRCAPARELPEPRALLGLRLPRSREPRSANASTPRSSIACSARRSTGSSSATSTSAPISAAAWTRARSPRSPRRSCPTCKTFTCGFDLQLGVGPRARLRRARERRAHVLPASRPSTTRWCSRPATWSACMPQLAWHLEEPRVGQSYPNYYVAQLAEQVRQGGARRAPAATSCSAAIPGAITAPSSTTTSSTTSTSTTTSGSG